MKTKKILSLLLALAMVLSLIPAALAAEDMMVIAPNPNAVAKVDDMARLEVLVDNIAAGYTESTDAWVIMDMAAYGRLGLGDAKTSDAAKGAYIDTAISDITAEGAADTVIAKAILGLSALGVDANKLYPAFADAAVSAVDALSAAEHSPSGWCAPYTFAAFNQGKWDTDKVETALIDTVLATQGEDGAWSEWGDSVQTTSNMITGLAFYKNQAKVKAAIDKALAFLSAAQAEDGTWDAYGYGPDSNTAAMVVIALAANGINPDTDERFIKNGVSALDFLLRYAYEDNTGFGYQSNANGGASDAYATEQAFRASVAAYQVMKTSKAFNVYDFSAGAKAPAYQSEVGLSGKHADVKKVGIVKADITFSDIAEHENKAQIEALAQRAVITGKEDGSFFDPDADMTRAEFATIVVKALGLAPAESDVFSDVPAGKWYSGFVGTAHAYGIVNGKGDGSYFDPFGTISRQEAACMVARAARLAGMSDTMDDTAVNNMLAQFGDYTDVAGWAKADVAFCYHSNILDQADWDVQPNVAILRCEIAEMLYHLLETAKLL